MMSYYEHVAHHGVVAAPNRVGLYLVSPMVVTTSEVVLLVIYQITKTFWIMEIECFMAVAFSPSA